MSPDAKEKLPSFIYTFTSRDAGGRWRGRSVRIFKRRGRPFWNVLLVHVPRGPQVLTALKAEGRKLVVQLAIEVCDRVWTGFAAAACAVPGHVVAEESRVEGRGARAEAAREVCTVGEILAVYRVKGPLRQKGRRTVPDNMNALRLVVREGLDRPELLPAEVDKLRCDVFSATLARRFEEGRLSKLDVDAPTYREARQSVL